MLVEIAHAYKCSVLVYGTIKQGIEYKLRIALVVAHLSLICKSVALLRKIQADSIKTCAVVNQ